MQANEPDLVKIVGFNAAMAKKTIKASKKRKPRTPKTLSALRQVIADNVKARFEYLYGKDKSHQDLVKLTGLSQGTLQRTLAGGSGLTVETLEQVANAAQMEIAAMFKPMQHQDITGEFIKLKPGEKALWIRFLELKNEIGKIQ